MSDPAPKQVSWWIGLILVALAVAPFLQTHGFEFVNYDDNLYVTENRMVQLGLTWDGVKYAFTTFEGGNWHPLTWLSHMTDCQLFRQGDGSQWPGGHHLVSVALHATNTLLVWVVLRRLTGAAWRGALVAALFAVHPLHVESVAWVGERKDVLSTMFGLLAVRSYIGYARSGGAGRYLAMLGFFILSLLAKPMLVTLPCLLLLLDIWPLRRLPIGGVATQTTSGIQKPRWYIVILEKMPLMAIAIAFSVVAVWSQKSSSAVSSLEMISAKARLANAAVAYAKYLYKLFVPIDLAVFYPLPGSWPAAQVTLSIVILVVITILAVLQRKNRPWLLIGWLWYLGMLVPVIGIVQVGFQSMADRYTYLPAIGIFIMLTWSIPNAATLSAKQAWAGLTCVGVAILGVMAHAQAAHWRNSRALFNRAYAVTQDNFMAHQNLGNSLEQEANKLPNGSIEKSRKLHEALQQFQKAVILRPYYGRVRENVANVLIQKGRLDEALEQVNIAITLDSQSFSAHNSLGVIMLARQQFAEAERALRRAVELDSANLEARGNHGLALLKTGKFTEAVEELSIVKRALPQRYGVRTNLALALAGCGRNEEALAELHDVLRSKPDFAPAQAALRQVTGTEAGSLGR